MGKLFLVLGLTTVTTAAAAILILNILQNRHSTEIAAMQQRWDEERAALVADLESANAQPIARLTERPPTTPTVLIPQENTPQARSTEIMARLAALKTSGRSGEKLIRQAIHDLEELAALGPAALPSIRAFLARNEDFDFRTSGIEGLKFPSTIPPTFLIPPTLRFGLLDVVRQTGGADAEVVLAEAMAASKSGYEVAWLAKALNGIAPDKYRDAALAAARDGLANPRATSDGKGYDRSDRDQLFSVLTMFGDTTYAATAQSQVVLPDNTVDRGALKYLMQTLGAQSVSLAEQLWNDPRLADPAQREPLARLALTYAGADSKANEFYSRAINDMSLTKEHRSNLIEDLNEDGFENRGKKLTDRDLPLIENRIALIEQLAPHATDAVNIAAFKEAYKDLVNMRERVLRPPVAVK